MLQFQFRDDAFGDRFELAALDLPRLAHGYALQRLDTDLLFDQTSGNFQPIRTPEIKVIFSSFDSAYQTAAAWVSTHCATPTDHKIAIVPIGYDDFLKRHILIYGVLSSTP